MVAKGKLGGEKSQTVNSETNPTAKKLRPQHCQCQFSQDDRCTNRASLFHSQVREPAAPVCSNFCRRDD